MAFGKGAGAATAQTVTIQQAGQRTFLGGVSRPKGIFWLGGGLIVANLLLSVRGTGFLNASLGTSFNPVTSDQSRGAVLAELALLGFLLVLATLDDEAGTAALVLVLGLWVLWYFNRIGPGLFGSNPQQGAPPQKGGGATGPN